MSSEQWFVTILGVLAIVGVAWYFRLFEGEKQAVKHEHHH
jgi:hypothetical protein